METNFALSSSTYNGTLIADSALRSAWPIRAK
jgi:hypothetical protein